MLGKVGLAVLAVSLTMSLARQKGLMKKETQDIVFKSKNNGFEHIGQV